MPVTLNLGPQKDWRCVVYGESAAVKAMYPARTFREAWLMQAIVDELKDGLLASHGLTAEIQWRQVKYPNDWFTLTDDEENTEYGKMMAASKAPAWLIKAVT